MSHAPSAPLPFFHSPYIPSIFYSPTLHPFIQAIAFTYTSISYYFLYPSILALSLLPLFSSFSRPLLCLSGFWIFSTCYGMGVTICLFPLSLILIRKSSQNFSHSRIPASDSLASLAACHRARSPLHAYAYTVDLAALPAQQPPTSAIPHTGDGQITRLLLQWTQIMAVQHEGQSYLLPNREVAICPNRTISSRRIGTSHTCI